MENFLLLFDELDDAIAILRAMWTRIAGLLLACGLLLGTGFALRYFPLITLAGLAATLSTLLAVRILKQRRLLHVDTQL